MEGKASKILFSVVAVVTQKQQVGQADGREEGMGARRTADGLEVRRTDQTKAKKS